eukprot:5107658-Prymnesium_polylepis.1
MAACVEGAWWGGGGAGAGVSRRGRTRFASSTSISFACVSAARAACPREGSHVRLAGWVGAEAGRVGRG